MERVIKKIIPIILISMILCYIILYVISIEGFAQPDGWTDAIRLTNNSADSWDPAIAIHEKNIHIVYSDDEGGAGSNTYLWYKNSTNGGKSWIGKVPLTIDPTMAWYPAIAVNESNIHVIWFEEKDYTIHYINSTDNGKSWSEGRSIAPFPDVDSPDISVNKSNIHITYIGSGDEIFYLNSTDNGKTWSNIQLLYISTSAADIRIAINGSNIHIIWNDISEIKYINSTDNGKTWSNIRTIEANSGVADIAVNGSNVNIIYRKLFAGVSQIYFMQSKDSGITWTTGKKLTASTVHIYDGTMAVNNEKVNIVWTDERNGNREIYFLNSSDNGGNWSSEIRLTFNLAQSLYSDIAISENSSHIVWADTRDGNYEIYYKHYPVPYPPTNLTIDIWDSNLTLNWTAPQNSPSPVDHYLIYRSTTWNGFDFSFPWVNTSLDDDNGVIPLRTSWNDTNALLDEGNNYFYIVRAIDAEGWNDTNRNIVGKYMIQLKAGWNLFSVPLAQRDTSISEVLESIEGNYDVVKWYDAKDGVWHSSGNDLTDINRTMGLWIYVNNKCNLSVVGALPESTDIALYVGCNMVGYPSLETRNLSDALNGVSWQSVWHYDAFDVNDPWKHNHTSKPYKMNDLEEMKPGFGYWVYVTIDDTWVRTRTNDKSVLWRVPGFEEKVDYQIISDPIIEKPLEAEKEDNFQIDTLPEEPPTIKNENNGIDFSFIPFIILLTLFFVEIELLLKRKK